MGWTTYDISEITDAMVTNLAAAVKDSPLWTSHGGTIPEFLINVTGGSPDTRSDGREGECQLNLYLLHVGQDPFFRNTPIFGPGAMANTQQPLSLNLSYLLTAYAKDNALREQQAMSIALAYFHETPIYAGPPDPVTGDYQFLTVSLGTDTLSEMSALWQSFTVAYRLSTIYRVAIAFITPSTAPTPLHKAPRQVGLAVAPADALFVTPQLYQPLRETVFGVPPNATDPTDVTAVSGLLAIVGGETVVVGGQGLDSGQAAEIFLGTLDGASDWPVTGWQTSAATASEITLTPPAVYAIGAGGMPPGATPPPGAYLLSVGAGAFRSFAIPVTIVPRFDNVAQPPVLHLAGGEYSLAGGGFVPGATQLFVGGVALDGGLVTVSPDGTGISFKLPSSQPAGTFPLRVRVEGVDAPPTWQVAA